MSFLRFLLMHALIGVAIGWTLLGVFLWHRWDGLGMLLVNEGWGPMALLFALFAFTFSSVSMGIGVMSLAWSTPGDDSGTAGDSGPPGDGLRRARRTGRAVRFDRPIPVKRIANRS